MRDKPMFQEIWCIKTLSQALPQALPHTSHSLSLSLSRCLSLSLVHLGTQSLDDDGSFFCVEGSVQTSH